MGGPTALGLKMDTDFRYKPPKNTSFCCRRLLTGIPRERLATSYNLTVLDGLAMMCDLW